MNLLEMCYAMIIGFFSFLGRLLIMGVPTKLMGMSTSQLTNSQNMDDYLGEN